jgi:hypothetical protein
MAERKNCLLKHWSKGKEACAPQFSCFPQPPGKVRSTADWPKMGPCFPQPLEKARKKPVSLGKSGQKKDRPQMMKKRLEHSQKLKE